MSSQRLPACVRFGDSGRVAAPIYGITIAPGYRDWKLISVAHEEGNLNDLRAQISNDLAIKAHREGKLPFPNSAIIVALHWNYVASEEKNKVFGRLNLSSPDSPRIFSLWSRTQKSTPRPATGVFADFKDGKPADEAVHKTCFPSIYASAIVTVDEIVGSISSL